MSTITADVLTNSEVEALEAEARTLSAEKRRIAERLEQISRTLVASGEAKVRMLRDGECDCLESPQIRRRTGGAIWGCPVHDPEHAGERREMLARSAARTAGTEGER